MAVLDKEKFFSTLHERIGTDTSEESLNFLEDMTDTYNDLEKRANGDGEDWEKKYHELDRSWREKYRHRFFTSDGGNIPPMGDDDEDEGYNPESITYGSLFEVKERK
jgi:hypothetical protein